MISIAGKWYDSRTSAQTDAICRIYDNDTVRVERLKDGETLVLLSLFDIKASPRLADTPCRFRFPAGEQFETGDSKGRDSKAVDMAMNKFNHLSRMRIVYLLENRKRYIALALASLLFFMWGSMKYGIPVCAKLLAFRLPISIHDIAGRHTLDILDRTVFHPSELDEITRVRLMNHFRPVMKDHSDNELKVVFRKGGHAGVNAFALPGGTIVLTDEIVRLAEHDDELSTVLIHEIGHIVHRHAIRRVIQDSFLGFALLTITGDISGSSEFFMGLPILLTELGYSRQFEREADRYLLDYLHSCDISPLHFVRLMRRIDQKIAFKSKMSKRKWLNYLSTHPETEKRLQDFKQ